MPFQIITLLYINIQKMNNNNKYKTQVLRLNQMLESSFKQIQYYKKRDHQSLAMKQKILFQIDKLQQENARLQKQKDYYKQSVQEEPGSELKKLKFQYEGTIIINKAKNYIEKVNQIIKEIASEIKKKGRDFYDYNENIGNQNKFLALERAFAKASMGVIKYQQEFIKQAADKQMMKVEIDKLRKQNTYLYEMTAKLQDNFAQADKIAKKMQSQQKKMKQQNQDLISHVHELKTQLESRKRSSSKKQFPSLQNLQNPYQVPDMGLGLKKQSNYKTQSPNNSHDYQLHINEVVKQLQKKIIILQEQNEILKNRSNVSNSNSNKQIYSFRQISDSSEHQLSQNAKHEKKMRDIISINQQLTQENEKLGKQLKSAQTLIDKLQKEAIKRQKYKSEYKQQEEEQQRIKKLEDLSKRKQEQIERLKKQIQNSQVEKDKIITVYQNESHQSKDKIIRHQDALMQLQKLVKSFKNKNQQIHKSNKLLAKQLSQKSKEVQHYTELLAKKQQELNKLHIQNEKQKLINEMNNKNFTDIEQKETKIQTLQQNLRQLIKTNNDIEQKMEQMERRTRQQLKKISQQKEQLDQHNQNIKQQKIRLHLQIRQKDTIISQLEDNIQQINKELNQLAESWGISDNLEIINLLKQKYSKNSKHIMELVLNKQKVVNEKNNSELAWIEQKMQLQKLMQSTLNTNHNMMAKIIKLFSFRNVDSQQQVEQKWNNIVDQLQKYKALIQKQQHRMSEMELAWQSRQSNMTSQLQKQKQQNIHLQHDIKCLRECIQTSEQQIQKLNNIIENYQMDKANYQPNSHQQESLVHQYNPQHNVRIQRLLQNTQEYKQQIDELKHYIQSQLLFFQQYFNRTLPTSIIQATCKQTQDQSIQVYCYQPSTSVQTQCFSCHQLSTQVYIPVEHTHIQTQPQLECQQQEQSQPQPPSQEQQQLHKESIQKVQIQTQTQVTKQQGRKIQIHRQVSEVYICTHPLELSLHVQNDNQQASHQPLVNNFQVQVQCETTEYFSQTIIRSQQMETQTLGKTQLQNGVQTSLQNVQVSVQAWVLSVSQQEVQVYPQQLIDAEAELLGQPMRSYIVENDDASSQTQYHSLPMNYTTQTQVQTDHQQQPVPNPNENMKQISQNEQEAQERNSSQVQAHRNRIQNLQRQVQSYKSQKQGQLYQYIKLQQQIETYQKQNIKYKQKIEELEKGRLAIENKISQIIKEMKMKDCAISKIKLQYESKINELMLEADNRRYIVENQKQEKEQNITILQQKLNQLQSINKLNEYINIKYTNNFSNLFQCLLHEISNTEKTIYYKLTEMEGRLPAIQHCIRKIIKKLEKFRNSSNKKYQIKQDELNILSEQIKQIEIKSEKYYRYFSERSQKQSQQLLKEIKQLQEKIEELEGRLQAKDKQLANKNPQILKCNNHESWSENENKNNKQLELSLNASKQQVQKYQLELSQHKSKISQYEQNVQKLCKQLQKYSQKLHNIEHLYEQLALNNKKLLQDKEQQVRKQEKFKKQILIKNKNIEKCEESIKKLESIQVILEKQIKMYKQQLQKNQQINQELYQLKQKEKEYKTREKKYMQNIQQLYKVTLQRNQVINKLKSDITEYMKKKDRHFSICSLPSVQVDKNNNVYQSIAMQTQISEIQHEEARLLNHDGASKQIAKQYEFQPNQYCSQVPISDKHAEGIKPFVQRDKKYLSNYNNPEPQHEYKENRTELPLQLSIGTYEEESLHHNRNDLNYRSTLSYRSTKQQALQKQLKITQEYREILEAQNKNLKKQIQRKDKTCTKLKQLQKQFSKCKKEGEKMTAELEMKQKILRKYDKQLKIKLEQHVKLKRNIENLAEQLELERKRNKNFEELYDKYKMQKKSIVGSVAPNQ